VAARTENEKLARPDQWARTALNGTTPLSSDAQVPRKLLTILD
jgi:hypothetical protein